MRRTGTVAHAMDEWATRLRWRRMLNWQRAQREWRRRELGWRRWLVRTGEVVMGQEHHARERFSDEELAFLRHARFGELPPRVRPEELVTLTETDARRDRPEPSGTADEWALRLGAAG